jgi:hypothetical protein
VVTRFYEGFLGLPATLVLIVLWLARAALGAACAVTLHEVGSVLLQSAEGRF